MVNFGDWLLKQLQDRDMSQSELARVAGVSKGTISNLINGTKGAGQESLLAVARALKLPPELVFEKAGIFPPKNTRSTVKNTAIGIIESLSEEDAAFIANFLTSYVRSKK